MVLDFKIASNPDRVLVSKDEIPFCSMNFDGDIFNPSFTEKLDIKDPKFSAFLKAYIEVFGRNVNGHQIAY